MFKNLPTMIWLVGATVAVTCFSPVVGNVVTSAAAPVAAAPPSASTLPSQPTVAPSDQSSAEPSEQPSPSPGLESPGEPSVGTGALPPTEDASTPPSKDGAENAVVIKAGTTQLGAAAVDADGFTLYLSTLDSTDPPKSVCETARCLSAWKPVYVKDGSPVAGAGVEQSKLGTVVRRDKDVQATLGGWPLYRFAKDQKPGDVLGQGLNGTWYAISPDGKKVVASTR